MVVINNYDRNILTNSLKLYIIQIIMDSHSKRILWGISWIILSLIQLLKIYLIGLTEINQIEHILILALFEFVLFSLTLFSKYKNEFILRPFFLFTFFFFFYNYIYPFIYFLVINISIFSWFKKENIYHAYILSTITFSILTQFSFIEAHSKIIKRQIDKNKENIRGVFQDINNLPLKKITFFSVYLLFSLLAIYYSFNYFTIPSEIKSNRNEVLKIIWAGPGVYIKVLLIGISIYLFIYLYKTFRQSKNKKRLTDIVLLIPILLFWITHILAGNRREIISLSIFIFTFYVIIKKIAFRKLVLIGSLLFLIMTIMSKNRGGQNQSEVNLYRNSFGEFIHPYNTLIETSRKNIPLEDYKLGSTYLYPFYAFIPRYIWPTKPLPIATQFSKNMDAGFGLGFSPLTEAYMNWGIFSIIILPIIIFLVYLVFLKLNNKFPCLYLFLIMNSLNLNRGELGTVILEILYMYIPFYLLLLSSKPIKNN